MGTGTLSPSKRYTAPTNYGTSTTTWADDWTVERMRQAIHWHDRGRFKESHAASEKVTQHAIIFGALENRTAPTLRFPRSVKGGTRGLDRRVREEAEVLFVGSGRELGPAFPSLRETLRALAMLGFQWWQTTYEPSPADDGTVVPVTQAWPAHAIRHELESRRWFATTNEEGEVELVPGDPRWTLIGGDQHDPNGKPWLRGAIRAIGREFVDGAFAANDRSEYSDAHGMPKPVGTLPEGVALGPKQDADGNAVPSEGDQAFESLQALADSRSGALFPFGMKFEMLAAGVGAAQVFKDILESVAANAAIVFLGTDGTMKAGSGGVYSSPQFGAVAEARVADDVEAIATGCTRILMLWKARNYPAAKVALRAVIEMPDTQRDARTKSISERRVALVAAIEAERKAGFTLTQERVNELAGELDLSPPILPAAPPPGAQSFAYDQENGVITIGERRAELGKPPSDRDELTIPQYRATFAAPAPGAPAADPASPAPAST